MEKANNIKINLSYIIFSIYLFFSITAQRSFVGNATFMLFVGFVVIYCIMHKKFYVSMYLVLELLFIVYSIWQLLYGNLINASSHREHVTTLILGLLFNIAMYNYFMLSSDYLKVVGIYVKTCAISLIFIVILYFNTVLHGRLSAMDRLLIFGGQASTSLAHIAGIALFFAAWRYIILEKRNQIAYLLIGIFSIVIFLTGTRKTLLLIAVSLFLIPLIKSGINVTNLIKRVVIFSILLVILYTLIMNVGFLYEVIGSRVNNVIINLTVGDAVDGSIFVRDRIASEATSYFQLRPLTGWGLDSFSTTLGTDQLYAHNNYLEILVSSGYVGFLIYFSRYLFIIIKLCTFIIKNEHKSTAIAFLILLISLMILEYWQVTFIFRPMMMPYIFIVSYLERNEENTIKKKDTKNLYSNRELVSE